MATITLSSDKSVVSINNKQYKASSPVIQRYINNPLNEKEKSYGVQIKSLLIPSSTSTTTPNNTINNVVSADGKTITVDGKRYVNDPSNILLKDVLAKQKSTNSSTQNTKEKTGTKVWDPQGNYQIKNGEGLVVETGNKYQIYKKFDDNGNELPATTGTTNTIKTTNTTNTYSSEAKALVDKVLKLDATKNLKNYDWWNASQVNGDAYKLLQETLASPESLANYVKSAGIENLQDYDWWYNSPYKKEAWNVVSNGATESDQLDWGLNPTTGKTPADTTNNILGQTPPVNTTNATQTTEEINAEKLAQAFALVDGSDLDTATASMFKDIIKRWDISQTVDYDNILTEFKNLKQNTIDPYYSKLVDKTLLDITTSRNLLMTDREREIESQNAQYGQDIKQAKANQETAGMTFTGQSIEALGDKSAYAIPSQTSAGGNYFEGTVNQANRLLSSSSQARYENSLQSLLRGAEDMVGSTTTGSLGLLGTSVGGVKGTIAENKNQDYASTLSSLAGQNNQNVNYDKYLTL